MPGPAARQLIQHLGLRPLPGEGGFFRETWRSEASSAIYFLLTAEDFSALHRLAQDEVWHFYAGDPVDHVQLDPVDGAGCIARLGSDPLRGDQPQVVVRAGTWQGARLSPASPGPHGYALLGCTLAPPWEERGFCLGDRAALEQAFPAHAAMIRALTR